MIHTLKRVHERINSEVAKLFDNTVKRTTIQRLVLVDGILCDAEFILTHANSELEVECNVGLMMQMLHDAEKAIKTCETITLGKAISKF